MNMKKKEVSNVEIDAKVIRANQVENTVYFDVTINGVTIYGCRVVEGSKGDFVSFPSHKGKDGKFYNHAWVKLSDEDTAAIVKQVEEML